MSSPKKYYRIYTVTRGALSKRPIIVNTKNTNNTYKDRYKISPNNMTRDRDTAVGQMYDIVRMLNMRETGTGSPQQFAVQELGNGGNGKLIAITSLKHEYHVIELDK